MLGVNLDDLGDHRPGQRAAAEAGAAFPFVDAGFTKAMVREASRALGLRTWDKPAAACLASRVPYGTTVSVSVLSRVERAEAALRRLGLRELRVRHYDDTARLEVPLADLAAVVERRAEVVDAVRGAGYRYVTLDLEGLRSGNLNQALVGLTRGRRPPRSGTPGGRAASSPDGHDQDTGPALARQGARPHPALPGRLLHRAAGRPRRRRGQGRGAGRRRRPPLRRDGRRARRPHLVQPGQALAAARPQARAGARGAAAPGPHGRRASSSRCARGCSTRKGDGLRGPAGREPAAWCGARSPGSAPTARYADGAGPRHHLPRRVGHAVDARPRRATTRRCPTRSSPCRSPA